jgi:hypothetical protein
MQVPKCPLVPTKQASGACIVVPQFLHFERRRKGTQHQLNEKVAFTPGINVPQSTLAQMDRMRRRLQQVIRGLIEIAAEMGQF